MNIRRITKEEIELNQLTSKEKEMLQAVIDTYNHSRNKGNMSLGGKGEATAYRKLGEKTGLVVVFSRGIDYSVGLTEKGIERFGER